MKIYTHNFNPTSNSGPNKFTRQLFRKMECNNNIGFVDDQQSADIEFCLIQQQSHKVKPMALRLDGIWFNSDQDYKQQNAPIKLAYENADAVIFQSQFNKQLTEHWFGLHENAHVIHNGADVEMITSVSKSTFGYPMINPQIEVWSCASSWRPHKRLGENIRYFVEQSPPTAILIVAGNGMRREDIETFEHLLNDRIFLVGELDYSNLLSLYKRSTTFVHLAYLDHCPNVVVDAQACGCKIICSKSGGTNEIVSNGIVIVEKPWDFAPIKLYQPPKLDFNLKYELSHTYKKGEEPCIANCAKKYYNIMEKML